MIERPKGHWNYPYKEVAYAYCSVCGKATIQLISYNFCPHCGSDMRSPEILCDVDIIHVGYSEEQCGRDK